jgi:hypothetical protein
MRGAARARAATEQARFFLSGQELAEICCRGVGSSGLRAAAASAPNVHCISESTQQYRRKAASLLPPWRAMLEAVQQVKFG